MVKNFSHKCVVTLASVLLICLVSSAGLQGVSLIDISQKPIAYTEGKNMFQHNNPFLFDDSNGPFLSLEPDKQWLALEEELRQKNLLYDPYVRWLARSARFNNGPNSQWARNRIKQVIEAERIEDMRTGNVFRPPAPLELLTQGRLHLFNQSDGIQWLVPLHAINRGLFLTGPQGGGKTRLLIYLCHQFNDLGIPFFVVDPKLELRDWASYLSANYIDISRIRLDMKPPAGLDYEQFLPALMPQLADVIGVIYGTEILQQAAQICIELREKSIENTGEDTQICLQDIYNAIPSVPGVSRGRRYGYREAVSTGLSRILTGSGDLFKCRRGIDLAGVFNTNCIIGCRSITDEFAARWLTLFLLYWLFESERFEPSTDQPKRAIIFDDASRYVALNDSNIMKGGTSGLTHILSRLRSSGNAAIFCSQVPHLADPGVLALSQTVACCGGLHYGPDTKVLTEIMGLNDDQRQALSRLAPREVVGICASSSWRKPVHGYTVDVP